MSENKRLSAKQEKALQALLEEPTRRAAAEAAGVSEATIWRWLADHDFSAAYADARAKSLESTLTALQAAGGDAVKTLKTVMNDALAKGSERVSAARCVLEMSLKAREVLEVEERLKALEERLNAQSAQGRKTA